MAPAQPAQKAVNVSIPVAMPEAARSHNIILSAPLESALESELRKRRREEWLATNRNSIDAYNREVDEHGAFVDSLRGF